jgi:asparagine synthase (glutamine-hydrolysing)
MVSTLRHRGPDDDGFVHEAGFSMGMRRLSIVDIAGGHQPISNEDGTVTVVCNGEIYNHLDLRRQLEQSGHRFSTRSDVEVLAHLYEELGTSCVERLRGMFGFAIWDAARRRLVLGRDRLGIKPLYYALTPDRLLFGSELKAIVASELVPLTIDEEAIDRFLTFGYVPAPLSIYREVRKLEPAHLLVYENGVGRFERYWDLRFRPDRESDARELADRFLAMLRDAVSSHLMGEVPLGAFLSGGIDSSLVVALMSEAMQRPVHTFTMAFGGSAGKGFDERDAARLVSRRYGTTHTEYEVEPSVEEAVTCAVEAFDEPFADDSVIPSYHICRLASRDVTVALTGLGGDELFAGYERHLGLELSLAYDRVPLVFRSAMAPLGQALPEPRDGGNRVNHLKRFLRSSEEPPARRYLRYTTVMDDTLKDTLYKSPALEATRNRNEVARFGAGPEASALSQALYHDSSTYLPDDILTLTDRLSMLHSLELRVPFLDHPLVEFCATIPDRFKIQGLAKKYLLRQVARPFLPAELMNRRKQGFGSPMASWFRHELKSYLCDALSQRKLERHDLFRPEAVRKLVSEHGSRRESHERPLFALLMFQQWWDRHH